MNEMERALQLLTYARSFFKGSFKSNNKTFSMSYGTAPESRKQKRISDCNNSYTMVRFLRNFNHIHTRLQILHNSEARIRAGNCSEYTYIAIKQAVDTKIPNVWWVGLGVHAFVLLADTPPPQVSRLIEFNSHRDYNAWVCDPWFKLHCKMHMYTLMARAKAARWELEGKEIYIDLDKTERASQWIMRLFEASPDFTKITNGKGDPTDQSCTRHFS